MYRYSLVYRRIVNNDKVVSELDKAIYELIYDLHADQAAIAEIAPDYKQGTDE
jgi:hypothetical protein